MKNKAINLEAIIINLLNSKIEIDQAANQVQKEHINLLNLKIFPANPPQYKEILRLKEPLLQANIQDPDHPNMNKFTVKII